MEREEYQSLHDEAWEMWARGMEYDSTGVFHIQRSTES